jgi:hypothetical protein
VPGAAEDFFNQADDPHGFFDSLPEQPSGDASAAAAAAAAAAGGMSSGGAAGLSNGGASFSEPATPMADANHVQEGTERVRCMSMLDSEAYVTLLMDELAAACAPWSSVNCATGVSDFLPSHTASCLKFGCLALSCLVLSCIFFSSYVSPGGRHPEGHLFGQPQAWSPLHLNCVAPTAPVHFVTCRPCFMHMYSQEDNIQKAIFVGNYECYTISLCQIPRLQLFCSVCCRRTNPKGHLCGQLPVLCYLIVPHLHVCFVFSVVFQEDDIQKAIFVGNYEGAVDTCLKVGRLADALLVANIGGPELFKRTMQRYMRRNPRPYMAVSAVMRH